MFAKYYESELAYLRELGSAFGLAHPSIAGLLAERGGDPDVERLLEGFAFLTARVRERLDQAVPEVVQPLTELLLPHYLRPLPACSIVELTPQARALRGRTPIPAGTELASEPVEGTRCLFRTTQPVDLLPLTVQDAALDLSSAQSPWLKLSFVTTEQGKAEVLRPEGFRLYVHGDFPLAATVMLWLMKHCRRIEVRDGAGKAAPVRLPPTALRFPGFAPGNALFPWPARALDGYRPLQEYFTLPQKFLFFDVAELAGAAAAVGEKFEVAFQFERPPPLAGRLGKDNFRLHCTPVANLFSVGSDPIRHRLLGEEHLLRASGLEPAHAEVYSVTSVEGLRAGQTERIDYRPFFDFAHAQDGAQAFYRVRRALSPVHEGIDTYLSLGAPSDSRPENGEQTLSIELVCTNRSLPARLQLGDIRAPTASSPTLASFRNIAPVTKPIRPPLESELHWRLLSHLAVNQRSLTEPGALRALLGVYNFQAGGDQPTFRANQLRVEALGEVRASPARRLLAGAPIRGMRTTVEMAEGSFAGMGDAFLFGSVLDVLLGSQVTLNAFHELLVRLQPSQVEFAWPARSGSQPLL